MPAKTCQQTAADGNQKGAPTAFQEIQGPNNIILRNSDYCQYKYDSERCIVEVNLLKKVSNDGVDSKLIMQLMEFDNIVLLMNNLCPPGILTLDKLLEGQTRSHDNFKIFKRDGWNGSTIVETKTNVTMNMSDYLLYLDKYKEVAKAIIEGQERSVNPVRPNVFDDDSVSCTFIPADMIYKPDR
jgi:hypothetical protein